MNESTFNVNDAQKWMWATDDKPVLQPKSKDSGILVSDFMEQHSGFICLTDQEHAAASVSEDRRTWFEHDAAKELFWTS